MGTPFILATNGWTVAAAVASILVALSTGGLAFATWRMADRTNSEALATLELAENAKAQLERSDLQLQLTTEALNTTVLPLLVDVPPTTDPGMDVGVFPAPGRESYELPGDRLYITSPSGNEGVFHLSVPFRNVGAGVAILGTAWTEPDFGGDLDVPARVIRPGDRLRVNLSVGSDHVDDEFRRVWGGGFIVAVAYHDARGGQLLTTRALVGTYATSGTQVRGISITKDGDPYPYIETGHMEYP